VKVTAVTNDPSHCEDSVLIDIEDPYLRLAPGQPISVFLTVGKKYTYALDTNIAYDLVFSCASSYVKVDPDTGVITGMKNGQAVVIIKSKTYPNLMIAVIVTVT